MPMPVSRVESVHKFDITTGHASAAGPERRHPIGPRVVTCAAPTDVRPAGWQPRPLQDAETLLDHMEV
jgi:hypothetical protein